MSAWYFIGFCKCHAAHSLQEHELNAIKPLVAETTGSNAIESGDARGKDWICLFPEEYRESGYRRVYNRQRHATLVPRDIRAEAPKRLG